MFGLGAGEVIIILVLALIFIGPKKLPELARGLGKSLREFQKAKNELFDELDKKEEQQKQVKQQNPESAETENDISSQNKDQ